jgi:hypothetical protein
MKLNRLETHDRLVHLHKDQALNVAQGAQDCLKKNPLSLGLQQYSPYVYLFAHPRTAEDGVNKRMIWQARLTKPKAQTNSYLFRAQSNSDNIEMCWMIPPREQWPQFKKGNVTQNDLVLWSIDQFERNRIALEAAFPDDLSDEQCKNIYKKVAMEMDEEKRMKSIYKQPTQDFSAVSQDVLV